MYFKAGSKVSIKTLIKAIHNPIERAKWDKDVESGKILELASNSKAMIFH